MKRQWGNVSPIRRRDVLGVFHASHFNHWRPASLLLGDKAGPVVLSGT